MARPAPKLVRYCPGSACGRVAWLTQAQAVRIKAVDAKYIRWQVEVGKLTGPVSPPHIGVCPPGCCRYAQAQEAQP